MYCPQCGGSNDDSARFCTTCGLDLEKYRQGWREPGPQASGSQSGTQSTYQAPVQAAPVYQQSYQSSYQPQYQPPYQPAPYYTPAAAYGATPRIKSYLGWAIATLILCFWPTGIVAVVYASQVGNKLSMGDYEGARRSSHKAKVWTWITFGIGVAIVVIAIIGVAVAASQTTVIY